MSRRSARRRAVAIATVVALAAAVATAGPASAAVPGSVASFVDASGDGALVRSGARVLFVGNSFTQGFEEPAASYRRDVVHDLNGTRIGGVPGLVSRLSDDLGVTLDISLEAVGGQSLQWHLDNRAAALAQPFDAVVAQEFSLQALPAARGGAPQSFRAAASKLHERVTAVSPSVRTVLFQTWASPASATAQGYGSGLGALRAMQKDLDATYADEARATGWTRLAPVGDAFVRAVDTGVADGDPTDGIAAGAARLWSRSDDRHAAAAGSYLAATVLTATLTGRSPLLLPVGEGSAAAAMGIEPGLAAELHRVAADVVAGPPAVQAGARAVCSPRDGGVRVTVRNREETPMRVRVAVGGGIRESPLAAAQTTTLLVPRADALAIPATARVTVRAVDDPVPVTLRVAVPPCVSGR